MLSTCLLLIRLRTNLRNRNSNPVFPVLINFVNNVFLLGTCASEVDPIEVEINVIKDQIIVLLHQREVVVEICVPIFS